MSSTPEVNPGYDPLTDPGGDLTRQSKNDALDEIEFELLLEGVQTLEDYYAQQARFCILVAGRLGLRKGEIAHLKADWADRDRATINIPAREPCQKGRDGGRCGECRFRAKQRVEYADTDLSFEKVLKTRWEPEKSAAVRTVPYDFDPRVQLTIDRFLDRYDGWPLSYQGITRRVKDAAEAAESISADRTYPDCLRASAASYHADRGLHEGPLKSLMGWASMDTASAYTESSNGNIRKAIREAHGQ